jgi:transcriptional regulator with GAF, ATPase, and Fis domain
MSMDLIAGLLVACRDSHTVRAAARALAAELARHARLIRVEVSGESEPVVVESWDGEWRCVDGARPARSIPIARGLAVVLARGERLPDYFEDPAFRAALAGVVEVTLRHAATVQRVADVSRRAHVASRELRADVARLGAPAAIVARSPAMRAALERATLVARHPTTVLLTGESGTGKEVLAREIHRLSPRAHRAMVQVNCGALPESLVEAELFGHERGAFTGAERARAGVFERAHRGTLFLDEVGDLPLPAQVKLLRVLQERRVRRLGASDELEVDVRLIAATNRPLAAMVRDGRFREDLFYRLEVFSIVVPPLRDRAADLGPLAATLIAEHATRLGIETPAIPRAAMARLEAHDWPGNVRELSNLLERAVILADGGAIDLRDDLPAARPRSTDFDVAVRGTIENALRATRGKIYGRGGAAERLGLKPGTLQSKMRKLGIARERFVT